VYIVCKSSAGGYQRHGIERFAYILTGHILLPLTRFMRNIAIALPLRVPTGS
jgi:hypothetical protein